MATYEIYDMSAIDGQGYADRLPEGWGVFRILTGNVMDECFMDMPLDMGEEEREEEMRLALRHKYGKGCGFAGYEDVTDLYR